MFEISPNPAMLPTLPYDPRSLKLLKIFIRVHRFPECFSGYFPSSGNAPECTVFIVGA